MWIVKFGKIVFIDGYLELIANALYDDFVGFDSCFGALCCMRSSLYCAVVALAKVSSG